MFSVPSAARFRASRLSAPCHYRAARAAPPVLRPAGARPVSSICSRSIGWSSLWKRLTPTMMRSPAFDLALVAIAGVGDLALREAGVDGGDHAAHLVDAADVVVGRGFAFQRQLLQEVAAAQRIGRIGHAALIGQHLLGAQRDGHGVLAGQRVRLIQRIGVQRLRAAQHRGHAPAAPCAPRCCTAAARSASSPPSARGSAA